MSSTAASPSPIGARSDARRRPQQQRSRAKVDAILAAANALVAEHGADALTTTLVAERAGVAVGSLYQYFDGVPAIVEALVAHHAEIFGEHLRVHLTNVTFTRKRDAANAALDALISYYRSDAAFRALWHSAPRVTGAGFGDAGEMLIGIITQSLRDHDLFDPHDRNYEREAKVQWAVATALIQVAFQMDPEGDVAVLTHLRRLFALDVRPPT